MTELSEAFSLIPKILIDSNSNSEMPFINWFLSELTCYSTFIWHLISIGFPDGSAVKRLPAMQETQVRSLGGEDCLEKEMSTLSSLLAWRTPWTEEPGRLQSIGLQRVGHDWVTSLFTFIGSFIQLLNHSSIYPLICSFLILLSTHQSSCFFSYLCLHPSIYLPCKSCVSIYPGLGFLSHWGDSEIIRAVFLLKVLIYH